MRAVNLLLTFNPITREINRPSWPVLCITLNHLLLPFSFSIILSVMYYRLSRIFSVNVCAGYKWLEVRYLICNYRLITCIKNAYLKASSTHAVAMTWSSCRFSVKTNSSLTFTLWNCVCLNLLVAESQKLEREPSSYSYILHSPYISFAPF